MTTRSLLEEEEEEGVYVFVLLALPLLFSVYDMF